MRLVGLFAWLFIFWLLLSGLFSPLLIALGAVSCLLATAAAWRLNLLDREAQPLELLRGAVTYWPWLIKEIIKSAWSVTKVVLHPQLPISPTMTVVKANRHLRQLHHPHARYADHRRERPQPDNPRAGQGRRA
jgi:multicomponent Na+:H+ antiporter subunit E